ncbi:MAG: hypothetical protein MUF48_22685 [Pirellulaceae bacterium]|nr:hypothetical protein [Pirellulaceae bacterium]
MRRLAQSALLLTTVCWLPVATSAAADPFDESGGALAPVQALAKGGSDATGQYTHPADYWKPARDHTADCPGGSGDGGGGSGGAAAQGNRPPCWVWGEVSGMAADGPNRTIWAVWGDRDQANGGAGRPRNYVIETDASGNIIKNWSRWDTLFHSPHQVYISPYDPERAIYIVERGGTQPGGRVVHEAIYKFSNDGETLIWALQDPAPKMSTQEQRAMTTLRPTDFGDPSVMTFLPDGRHFLLADGYMNGRVQTWTVDGEWVREFGEIDRTPEVGGAPGAFDLMHGIAVDRAGRIYVGDRRNARIQVFTPAGQFIEEWPDVIDPVGIYITGNDDVWVVSAALNRLLKYNTQGHLLYHWGTHGRTAEGFPGGFARPHQVDVDSEGNVYVASWDWPGMGHRFTPKPGADPSKLIGPKLGSGTTH